MYNRKDRIWELLPVEEWACIQKITQRVIKMVKWVGERSILFLVRLERSQASKFYMIREPLSSTFLLHNFFHKLYNQYHTITVTKSKVLYLFLGKKIRSARISLKIFKSTD